MRLPAIIGSKKRVIASILSGTTLVVGTLALAYNPPTPTGGASTGSDKDLAASLNAEQKLMDAIRNTQKDVAAALKARTAAVNKYANVTGGATLYVQKQQAPKTTVKTRASGGAKSNEFDRD